MFVVNLSDLVVTTSMTEIKDDYRVFMTPVVKLLNQRWWIPVFRRNSNMTGDIYRVAQKVSCCTVIDISMARQ